MDFSKLSDSELDEFLELYGYPKSGSGTDRIKLAENLFEHNKEGALTDAVIDLYLATSYVGPKDTKYVLSDLLKLSEFQIATFANIFRLPLSGDLELDRTRVIRILRILGLIFQEQKTSLLLDPVLQNLCLNLGVEELNRLRLALNRTVLECRVPIADPNGNIKFLPKINDLTVNLARQIAYGSADALIWALDRNNNQALEELLKLGANPNFKYYGLGYVSSPLFWAISLGQLESIKILLKYGADPNQRLGSNRLYPISYVLMQDYTQHNELYPRSFQVIPEAPSIFVKIPGYEGLEEEEQKKSELLEQLSLVTRQEYDIAKKIAIIDQLLKHGARLNFGEGQDNVLSYYAYKAANFNPTVIRHLVQKGLQLNEYDEQGIPVLYAAVISKNLDLVKLLLELGASPNYLLSDGESVIEVVRNRAGSMKDPTSIQSLALMEQYI